MEEHTIPPRKKLAEMTPEERRAYNVQAKQKSRERQKQERLASQIPVSLDYQLPRTQQDQLAENANQITATITAELPDKLSFEDERMIEMMADVILANQNGWKKQVQSPHGYLYGRYHPDAAASEVIEHIHRFPNLLESRTFSDLYQNFLKRVRKLSRNTTWFDPEFAKDIEAEINGTYTLPTEPETPTAPEPAAVPETPKVPNDKEILERGRLRLLEQIQNQIRDPLMPPEARSYLNGN